MTQTKFQYPYAVDQGASPPGTNANAALVNALVFAQTMLTSGGIPTTNGTLSLTQPATTVGYNDGASNLQTVTMLSQGLTFTANKDTYLEVTASGTYYQNAVNNGAGQPALNAGSILQLYKAVSNGSAVTSITPLATGAAVNPYNVSAPDESTTNNPALSPTDTLQQTIWRLLYKVQNAVSGLLQTAIAYDSNEAATTSGSSSLLDNLNHIRNAIASLYGAGSFASVGAKKAILEDGTNSGTWGTNLDLGAHELLTTDVQVAGRIMGSGPGLSLSGTPTSGISSVSTSGNARAGTISFSTSISSIGPGDFPTYFIGNFSSSLPYTSGNPMITIVALASVSASGIVCIPFATPTSATAFDLHVALGPGIWTGVQVQLSYHCES